MIEPAPGLLFPPKDPGTMDHVRVKKDKLLDTLRTNRDAHRAIFEEALVGYKEEALRILHEHLERIQNNKVERVYVVLPEPSDHTEDYDRIISMLEWSEDDEIELTIRDFDQYVRDNWNWKQEFITSNSVYAASIR